MARKAAPSPPPTLQDGTTRGKAQAPAASPLAQAIVGAVRGRAQQGKKPPAKKATAPPRRPAQRPGVGGLAIGQRPRGGGGMPPPLA